MDLNEVRQRLGIPPTDALLVADEAELPAGDAALLAGYLIEQIKLPSREVTARFRVRDYADPALDAGLRTEVEKLALH
ncbi:MAG: hypothetical protein V4505_11130 [Pseudomonadota bacterium]